MSIFLMALALPAAATAGAGRPILALDAGGHTDRVWKLLFTPDGRELISVSDDKTIRTWDVATGDALRVLRPPIGPGPEGKLYAAALAPDGHTLAVGGFGRDGGDHPVYLIDLSAGRLTRVLRGHLNVVKELAFDPTGARLASASADGTVRLWDVAGGRTERVLQGHTGAVDDLAFSPDGRRLASVSQDATGRVWSVADGRVLAVLRGHTGEVRCVAWSPDGRVIATGGYDSSLRLWNFDGTPLRGPVRQENWVGDLAFTPDSRTLLLVWGGQAAPSVGAALLDPATGRERLRFARHDNVVRACAFSPDGRLAATSGGNDNEIFLWKTADGTPVHRLASRGHPVMSAAWSADGSAIAWGHVNAGRSFSAENPLTRAFRLADLEFAPAPDATYRRAQLSRGPISLQAVGLTGVRVLQGQAELRTLRTFTPNDFVRCFTLLPGDRAAVGSFGGLTLFDLRTGRPLRSYLGHTGIVWCVAPAPDGRHLLSGASDQTLRIWDVGRDEPVLSLFVAGDDWVAWTPEGYYAASPGGERLIGWHVNNGPDQMASFYPAARFRKTLYRPDVVQLVPRTASLEQALELADRRRGTATEKTDVADVLPPEVEVASPRPGARLTAPSLEVKALARARGGHPVTALRLLLDGRPYRDKAGVRPFDPPRLGETRASWTVALDPGAHTLTVQADSAVSSAVSAPVAVTVAERRDEDLVLPRMYVLAVGIAEYPGDLRLHYAAKDAEALERMLRQKSTPLYRSVESRLLTDGRATRRAILGGLTWLRQQMTQRDVAVLFFSGHGQQDSEGSLYLLPSDVDTDDLLSTAVSDDQLKKALAALPGRVLALLDACHSGAAGGDRRKGVTSLTDDLVRDLVTDDFGVIVMASSMGRESSLESNAERQGCFTLALVEGLAGKADLNGDGVVYLNELDAYLTDRVKALTRGKQHPVTAKPTSIRSFPLAKP